ncbi:MAG: ABC transporter ATPase subunit [Candidatus Saganbacteria bacterium]|uniref:ABC transporter ATPase subunit n=1 Tax=Candidatus Saganbacteria bacterium TaxID=2575572 RepID=A0A833NY25_UNCSA|nr:MAG: ABC transporter ATPase subunit [Candidatus Saganbacteria bacterium]
MTSLSVKKLTCGYGDKVVLNNISFEVESGTFLGIVGPNGCGKTTLLKAIGGIIKSDGVEISEKNRNLFSLAEIAREIAYVPQLLEPIDGLKVKDLVMLGRSPHQKRLSVESDEDNKIADWAMERLKVKGIKDMQSASISGGEFQRVSIARALAQQTNLLLLDEPTSHLDIRHQIGIIKILAELEITVVAAFHDLNLAARFCQKILLMKKGEIKAIGKPEDILTAENIWDVYKIKAEVNKKSGHIKLLP